MKIKESLMQKLNYNISRILRPVSADEPPATPPVVPPATAPTVNFEELISKARREEKDKLYPEIERLKTEAGNFTKKLNDLLIAIGEKDVKISELTKSLKDAESNKGESTELKDLKAKVAQLEGEKVVLLDNHTKELSQIKLNDYKKTKIEEAGGKVIPELVTGTTAEEIDASIETAKTRYTEILKGAGVQPTNPTYVPPANPSTAIINLGSANLEDISKMSPTQWAEYRKTLGLK